MKSIYSVNNITNCYFGYKTEKWKMEKTEHKIDEFAKGWKKIDTNWKRG